MEAWVVALVSCVHVALAVVRQHRSTPGLRRVLLTAAGYGFALAAWVWTLPSGLIVGAAAHVAWLLATDSFATARPASDDKSSPRPAAPSRAAAPAKPAPPPRPAAPARSAAAPRGFVPLQVLATIDETADIRTFRLSRPEGFDFKAGQFLPVRFRVDGEEQVRCYSISSAPHVKGFLEISVKRQGLVSNALHATLRPGATLFGRAPAGAFVYPDADDRPLVLLAAGVGITPLASMLRHALHVEPQRPVVLVQSATKPDQLAYADEFRVLKRRHETFRWVPAVSRVEAAPEFYPGRIDHHLLGVAVPAIEHSVVCICGPERMIAATREVLAAMGVPKAQVRYELFEAAIAASGADAAPAEEPAAAAAAGGSAPTVTFNRSGAAAPSPPGKSLLEVAERSGVSIPSLCRAGVCGTCRTKVTSGDVRCQSTALDDEDAANGYVLACVAHATSDCAVDA
jgi:ferredoxin-NADP reductase